ncbi:hypothetical protein MXB_4449 [Myxobolus squamalis]|nr:hypothetical protein MXB_4449 [Myxobolus squamalis]
MRRCGGIRKYHVDEECRNLFQEAHGKIANFVQTELGNYKNIELLGYGQQLVCGIKYFFRVSIDGKIKWIEVHRALPCYGGELEVIEMREDEEIQAIIEQ